MQLGYAHHLSRTSSGAIYRTNECSGAIYRTNECSGAIYRTNKYSGSGINATATIIVIFIHRSSAYPNNAI